MTVTREYTIWCDGQLADGDRCPDFLQVGTARSPRETRAHGAELGWVEHDGRDLCPVHTDGHKRGKGGPTT